MGSKRVVWEWQERFLWIPYSAEVSNFIEGKYLEGKQTVNLRQADQNLSCYEVDIQSMNQTRTDTGTVRGIRRTLCPHDSPPGNGIIWMWLNNYNHWILYDIQTACDLEKAYSLLQQPCLDLSTSLGIPNIVDFQNMMQTSKHTGKKRQVKREVSTKVYPFDTGRSAPSVSVSSSGHSLAHKLPTQSINGVTPRGSSSGASAFTTGGEDLLSIRKKLKVCQNNTGDPLQHFCTDVRKPPSEECAICFEKLSDESGFGDTSSCSNSDVKQLNKCKHCFHKACLLEFHKSGTKGSGLQCPTCKTIHGIKLGMQPTNGKMHVSTSSSSLPGFPGCGMITITYDFKSGIQGPEHPNPGKKYYIIGFPRICYLPDNKKGQKVLQLLRKAWDRRLIFTIGTSVTMGLENAVVWNEIHHKTEAFSNKSGHGYPDPNYLDNILAELASQGVEDNDESQ